jgi:hypothetical protein
VFFRTLSKEALCRVPRKKKLGKRKYSAKNLFAECLTLGKEFLLPSVLFLALDKKLLPSAFFQH